MLTSASISRITLLLFCFFCLLTCATLADPGSNCVAVDFGNLPGVLATNPDYARRVGPELGKGNQATVYAVFAKPETPNPLSNWVAAQGAESMAFKTQLLDAHCPSAQAKSIIDNFNSANTNGVGVRLHGAKMVTVDGATYLVLAMENFAKPPPGATVLRSGSWGNASLEILGPLVPESQRTAVGRMVFSAAVNVADSNQANVLFRVFEMPAGSPPPAHSVALGGNRYFQAAAIDQGASQTQWGPDTFNRPPNAEPGSLFYAVTAHGWSDNIARKLGLDPEEFRKTAASTLADYHLQNAKICNPLKPRPNPFGSSPVTPVDGLPPLVNHPFKPGPNPFLGFTPPPAGEQTPACGMPPLRLGRIVRHQSWRARAYLQFQRSMGTNASAALGYLGNHILGFGQAQAQERYLRTAFLLDEYTFALTQGASEAQFTSMFPDDMNRCFAESVQMRPYCPGGTGTWARANDNGVSLLQPVDLEKKFKQIVTQTSPENATADVEERLDEVRQKIYALLGKPGDTSAERAQLQAEEKQLSEKILVYREQFPGREPDPQKPGETYQVWNYEVGLSIPITPFVSATGQLIDPKKINPYGLDEQERLFLAGIDKGRVRIPNALLQALVNAKLGGCTTCCGKGRVTLEDIRSVWAALYERQENKIKEAARNIEAGRQLAQELETERLCNQTFTGAQTSWNNALKNLNCKGSTPHDQSELRASVTSLIRWMNALSTECPPPRLAALIDANPEMFAKYRKIANASRGGGNSEAAFVENMPRLCDELASCKVTVPWFQGFKASEGEDGFTVLTRIPGRSDYEIALRAETDGRFFATAHSPFLQEECAQYQFTASQFPAPGQTCGEMFPAKEHNGGIWYQRIVVDPEKVCGKALLFDTTFDGPNAKTTCKVKVRFHCEEEQSTACCFCPGGKYAQLDPRFSFPTASQNGPTSPGSSFTFDGSSHSGALGSNTFGSIGLGTSTGLNSTTSLDTSSGLNTSSQIDTNTGLGTSTIFDTTTGGPNANTILEGLTGPSTAITADPNAGFSGTTAITLNLVSNVPTPTPSPSPSATFTVSGQGGGTSQLSWSDYWNQQYNNWMQWWSGANSPATLDATPTPTPSPTKTGISDTAGFTTYLPPAPRNVGTNTP